MSWNAGTCAYSRATNEQGPQGMVSGGSCLALFHCQLNVACFSNCLVFHLQSMIFFSDQNLMMIEKFRTKFVEGRDGLGRRAGGEGGCQEEPRAQGNEAGQQVLLFLRGLKLQ